MTVPNFVKVGLDTPVVVRLAGQADEVAVPVEENRDDEQPSDRGLTLGNLPSALGGVESVTPQSTFDEVITKMLLNDYSQLAVLTSPFSLRGAITWQSIAQARHDNHEAKISRAIVQVDAISYDAELVDVLPRLYEDDFIFVKGPDNRISGIVTAADVVLAYGNLSMPFLLVGQIDMLLRRLLAAHLDLEDVTSICGQDGARNIRNFNDLTIGDYQRAFEAPHLWSRLDWNIDRATFVQRLDEIRTLRNDIMHFDPSPLPEDAIATCGF